MKAKRQFVCNECGYITQSWIGKCPECSSWNSFIEESIDKKKERVSGKDSKKVVNLSDIQITNEYLLKFNNEEINAFFGGGISAGSVILVAGEPGVGKSTLLLFLFNALKPQRKVIYFTGEESLSQIKKRTDRLNINSPDLLISNNVDVDEIIELSKINKPDMIFVDSIQTLFSKDVDTQVGNITQIKYCTGVLINFAKETNVPVIIIGHITKTGDIAGPKLMEHMVDVVLYFEGETQYQHRFLRSIKNRFGSIDELLLFEMKEKGLIQVENPASYFIEKNINEDTIGKCKTVIISGKRPLILEVEALIVPSGYSNARRFSEGVDIARISRISAILDKYLNENLNNYDIYFNISGGIKTNDVGIDLAIAVAIYSSKQKIKLDKNLVVMGELSLTGRVRNIRRLDLRIKEAIRFGCDKVIIPYNETIKEDIKVKSADNIINAINFIK
jgi:DNA repair protein RadA/Sms